MCTHIKPAQNNTQHGKCGRIISAGATQRPVCFVVLKQECATAQKAVCYWLSTYVYMLSFPLILFTSGPNIFASQSVVVLHWSAPLHQQDVPCLRASASRRRGQGCSCRQCRGCLVVSLLNLHLIQVCSSSGWEKKPNSNNNRTPPGGGVGCGAPPPQKNKENCNTSIKKSSHEDKKGKKKCSELDDFMFQSWKSAAFGVRLEKVAWPFNHHHAENTCCTHLGHQLM